MEQASIGYRQTLRDVVSIFFYKKTVVATTLLGVVLGTILVIVVSPTRYKTHADLLVKPPNVKPFIIDGETGRIPILAEVTNKDLNTVIFLLTSPEVLRQTVIRLGLADPEDDDGLAKEVGKLKAAIKAEPLTDSNVIRVTLKGSDPHEVARKLQALINVYMDYHIRINAMPGVVEFMERQTAQMEREYDRLSRAIREAMRRDNVIDPEEQKVSDLKTLENMRLKVNELKISLETVRAKRRSFEKALATFRGQGRLIGLPRDVMFDYPALVEMERTLAQLIINVQRARNDYLPGSKQVQDAESQYWNMRKQIQKYMEQIINDLKVQEDNVEHAIKNLNRQMNDIMAKALKTAAKSVELERLWLKLDLTKKHWALYSEKQEESRIREAKDRARFINVKVAAPPQVPLNPYFPRPVLMLTLAAALGSMLALAVAAVIYTLEQRLRTPTDIALHTTLRLLGTLDAVPGRRSHPEPRGVLYWLKNPFQSSYATK